MSEKNFNIQNYSVETLKNILWQLCYEPDDVLKRLKISDMSAGELTSFIFEECRKNSKVLLFGEEKPFSDTKGIDLGVKNNIVRDAIIQRCYRAIFDEQHNIGKAIKLIKTEDDASEIVSRKIFGGLREIGFSNKEANYIKETCNPYPIALLLERLNEDLMNYLENGDICEYNPITNKVVSTPDIDENMQYESHCLNNVNDENQEVTVFKILENKDDISQFLKIPENQRFTNIESMHNQVARYKSQIEILERMITCAEKLEKAGINLNYLNENKDIISELILVSNRF